MKHLFYSIVLFAVSFRASAQSDTITHIIERGESIEYLAERYCVAEADIRNCNGTDFDLFYTGMEIRIPMPRRNTSVAAYSTATHNSYYASKCEQADKLLNSGDYKKAIKAYSELIKGYSSSQPCTEAYYGRALAYYNRGKWKNAIRDFETVIDNTDLSENARSQCKDLLAKAKENREAQLEERGQMWAGLIGAAAMTTAAVISAKQQAKAASRQTTQTTHSSSSSNGSYSDDGDDDVSVSSNSNKKTSCSGPRKYNCGNTGICALCGGDGFMGGQFGEGANSHKCTLCGGSGNCKYCN